MGCSQSLFNNQSCAVALSPEAVGHHGGHTLVRVRLLLHLCVQTENWKSCQNSCLRTSADLLALWNHHHQQVNHCQRPARHFCACVKQDSYGEGFLAATAFGCAVLCCACAVSCCFSWEQPEERGPDIGRLRDSPCQASKVPVHELTATMDMKLWERAKELSAITDRLSSLPGRLQTSLPSQTLFNNRLTEFFWAFLVLKGCCLKQLKRQPTYPIRAALFDPLFLWHCLGYLPPTALQCKFTF